MPRSEPPSRFALRASRMRSLTIRVSRCDVERDCAIGQHPPEGWSGSLHAQHDAHPPDLQQIGVKPVYVAFIRKPGPILKRLWCESGASRIKVGECEAGDVIRKGQIALVAVVPHQLSRSR